MVDLVKAVQELLDMQLDGVEVSFNDEEGLWYATKGVITARIKNNSNTASVIADSIYDALNNAPNVDALDSIFSEEYMRDNLQLQLRNKDYVMSNVKDPVIVEEVGKDMVLVMRVKVDIPQGDASFVVTKPMVAAYPDLFDAELAKMNTPEPVNIDTNFLVVVQNPTGIYLNPTAYIGNTYIPSSISELIKLPSGIAIPDVIQMIAEANKEQLQPKEVLSYYPIMVTADGFESITE